jgi:hypothetical protein
MNFASNSASVFLIVATIAGIPRQSDSPPEVEKAIAICG